MAEFLLIAPEERKAIYTTLAAKLGRAPAVLEKDVWVCWALQTLFGMPNRMPMAFKGGTALSKVFRAIDRFSEDIDVTLDYRSLDNSFNPHAEGTSKSRIRKFGDNLKELLRVYTHERVAPHFQSKLVAQFGDRVCQVELSESGEDLRLHYPTALEVRGDYMRDSVLIEFGGRNIAEPNQDHHIHPDIAEHVTELEFPHSSVAVLPPERTFWEKATLMHDECLRENVRVNAERLSRHWYDIYMLAEHTIGKEALSDRAILAEVVRHKKVFFSYKFSNYDICLTGALRLLPDEAGIAALRADFDKMVSAGFIYQPPAFEAVVDRLRALEAAINAHGK